MRYQEMAASTSFGSPEKGHTTLADFQRKDALSTLVTCILNSSYDIINAEIEKISKKNGQFAPEELRKILSQHG